MQDSTMDPRRRLAGGAAAGDFGREIASLRGLNRRFLDLACAAQFLNGRLGRLSAAQKDTIASCPYALFDVRLHDAAHWQARLGEAEIVGVADAAARTGDAQANGRDSEKTDFLQLALFFAWHVAASSAAGVSRLAPLLVLGMPARTAAVFARIPVAALQSLAHSEAGCLSVRWPDCDRYWSAVLAAAEECDASRFQSARLYGIQLAAAAQLPLRPEPREV